MDLTVPLFMEYSGNEPKDMQHLFLLSWNECNQAFYSYSLSASLMSGMARGEGIPSEYLVVAYVISKFYCFIFKPIHISDLNAAHTSTRHAWIRDLKYWTSRWPASVQNTPRVSEAYS